MEQLSNITVGINTSGYPEKRNIIDPQPAIVRLKKVKDLMKVADYPYFKLRKKNHPFFHNVFYDLGINRVDLYHFFNVISLGKKPWIVTFENELPRHNQQSEYLFKKLAGRSCKKIIALSENAARIESYFLKKFPVYEELIKEKMVVMQPPQALHIKNITEKKKQGDRIHFTFVGGAFFHKGGQPLLQAFVRLVEEFPNTHLNIVSGFSFNHWYDTEYGPAEVEFCKKLMATFEKNITYFPSMSNPEVIDLFLRSDVAVLPSFGETYGYSVLEAQSCGCPVITTNAWAFPEFNNDQTGWLLDLPLTTVNGGLRSDLGTTDKKKKFVQELEEKLYLTMSDICREPSVITKKAAASIENIRQKHSMENYSHQLLTIYQNALS